MRTAKVTLISISWMLLSVAESRAAGAGTLSGAVVDDSGQPIAGALVTYSSVQTHTKGATGQTVATGPLVGSGVKTGADGRFAVSGLPPATYHLCAYGLNSNDLGSCEWGAGTVTVNLATEQTAEFSFQITEGVILTFSVNDPNHRILDLADLPTTGGRLPLSGGNFAVGIWAGTRYARATLVSTSGTVRQYQIAIPKTAVVRLFLDTSLSVSDATGATVPARQPSLILSPGGQAGVTTSLNIP